MRRVVWSADARREYLDVINYIANENPIAAEKVADAIEKAGHDLGDFATGRPGRVTGTYEKAVSRLPYIIAYELREIGDRECVVILHIVHGSRDWPDEEWPR
jgi:toxin ParE1/3/4